MAQRKLRLNRETLRNLTDSQARRVVGGTVSDINSNCVSCTDCPSCGVSCNATDCTCGSGGSGTTGGTSGYTCTVPGQPCC
jgi:hypothetical protein